MTVVVMKRQPPLIFSWKSELLSDGDDDDDDRQINIILLL